MIAEHSIPGLPQGPDGDAAAPGARLEHGSYVGVKAREDRSEQAEVHVADDLGVALGDGVEGAVAQAHDAGVVLVGFVAALAQEPVEVGRIRGSRGYVASERLSGAAQRTPRSPVLVMRRGAGKQPGRQAVVARRKVDHELALGALIELGGPAGTRTVRPERLA